ncbi:hypothetical protein [Pseudodesulfovibrio sediminis]|uniref:Uncharacterized protein n=1 Tax=Pseudodesulfovibrio sediminis TaxID=2810563 RepID=A0ABN6EPC7_9BACT|nr:hypothetical protein [Pseudodesulfovibrio sediminis]BCS88306.1 hypothetical protein PSDVSF_15480 [Pseudodesulfovibrio sediminis]
MHTESNKCTRLYCSAIMIGTLLTLVCLAVGSAQALMPPETYAQASRHSRIKAIATIVNVDVGHVGPRATSKVATFRLEYALTGGTPRIFTGSCLSLDTRAQRANVMVGGATYFYPHTGNRVYVTISENGGRITSMTPMSAELERVIRYEPDRLIYGVTSVRIIGRKGHRPKAVIRRRIPAAPVLQLKDKGAHPPKVHVLKEMPDHNRSKTGKPSRIDCHEAGRETYHIHRK